MEIIFFIAPFIGDLSKFIAGICFFLLLLGLSVDRRLARIQDIGIDLFIPFVPQSAWQFVVIFLLGVACLILAKVAKDLERYG